MQAKRICELIELFGVNTFSSMDEHNVWGSWPADYRPEQVIAALKYLTAETGFVLSLREYHYAGRESFQRPWLGEIKAALPGTKVTLCVGANGSADDVQTMLDIQADWYEGLNEPNTDFGSGEVPIETTMAIQKAVWQPLPRPSVMGPSIVGGMPHPSGWVTGYCGEHLGELNAQMALGNGHFYPPHCPDLTGDGCSLTEYVTSLQGVYGHPIMLTEFHPSLYNADGNGPTQPGWDGQRDAYYALLSLFRAGKLGVGLWWYALFDYGQSYQCGLFPTKAEHPRPAADALRRLCAAAADGGLTMRSFAPGDLDVTVNGLADDCDWDLYQASDGRFLLPLWRAGADPGGEQPTIINAIFAQPCAHITEHDLLTGQTWTEHNAARFEVWLANDARLLVIEP